MYLACGINRRPVYAYGKHIIFVRSLNWHNLCSLVISDGSSGILKIPSNSNCSLDCLKPTYNDA